MTLIDALAIFVYLNHNPEMASWARDTHLEALVVIEKHVAEVLQQRRTAAALKDKP